MISHEDALQVIRGSVGTLGQEEVATAACAGRILASDLVARLPSPPFDKAAMDGFAVRAADVGRLPVELTLVGASHAGRWPDLRLGPGQCASISTGAPLPQGADMVVMVEHTTQLPGSRVRVERPSGHNVCPMGEDIRQGQLVLRAGQELTALRVGVAASAGYDRLRVFRRPTIALLCTGTEVVEPGEPVQRGQIYNSNGPILRALLTPLSASLEYLGIAGDQEDDLQEAVRRGLKADVLVISGGVSVGRYDLVPSVLERLGVRILFRECAIRPGKPVLFGTRSGTCLFGLPGNPQSCFVVFHVLLRPALAMMSGAGEICPAYRTGLARVGFPNKPDRKHFVPCRVEVSEGLNYLTPVPCRGSADIMSASAASAYLVVPQGVERVEAGQRLLFFEV